MEGFESIHQFRGFSLLFSLQVLSGLVDPLPSRYSLELWDVMRACLTQDPAHRPTVDELLAMPAVSAASPGVSQ